MCPDPADGLVLERAGPDSAAELLGAMTEFHNATMTAVHTVEGTAARCRDTEHRPIHLVLHDGEEIVGLIESRLVPGRPAVRLLETLAVAPAWRGRGLARRLFDRFMSVVSDERHVVVRFRESRRPHLEAMYCRFGFQKPVADGAYANGEARWRMVLFVSSWHTRRVAQRKD